MARVFVRVQPLAAPPALGRATAHARGQDLTARSRRRDGLEAGSPRAIGWQRGWDQWRAWAPGDETVNYWTAWESHVAETGARLRKRAPAALHLIVGVSPGWVAERGDPHDWNNVRVRALTKAAVQWAQRELGGVIAARYDVDEEGSSIVDVIAAPVREGRGRQAGKWISTNKALSELQVRCKRRQAYAALQDSWHAYAREHVDQGLERGRPKRFTGRENVPPEAYKEGLKVERKRLADGHRKVRRERRALEAEADRQDLERMRIEYEEERLAEAELRSAYEREQADLRITEADYERERLEEARAACVRQAEGWLAAAAGKPARV